MLNDLATRLTLPGLPEWTGLVALLVLLLLAVCLLVMPFSVFGLKGRLDSIEAQLDDLRAELRVIAARQPDARREGWDAAPPPAETYPPATSAGRAEPRISWPRQS
ncbi:hypothetical protein [Sediminicoccus sp. KRV36]|uniref:hypothetical protein n=1 Tax=Sediminicoccus sp. KRV36 TaxID=3133721 RepID=UPI00200C6892|nr:hypothetical protein [Sediminicoccus rosea]UPY38082.1 hypothetical protein LHU95_05115 [Sediminicoccus rosea]